MGSGQTKHGPSDRYVFIQATSSGIASILHILTHRRSCQRTMHKQIYVTSVQLCLRHTLTQMAAAMNSVLHLRIVSFQTTASRTVPGHNISQHASICHIVSYSSMSMRTSMSVRMSTAVQLIHPSPSRSMACITCGTLQIALPI